MPPSDRPVSYAVATGTPALRLLRCAVAKKVLSDAFATLSLTASVLREHVTQIVKGRFDRRQIASIDRLVEFNQMRAAYVAQTSLYGYLKTRMGSKYVQLFQDDTFSASIDTAKWPVYASCLADLTVFSCALVHRDGDLDRDAAAGLAVHCFRHAVERTFPPGIADRLTHAASIRPYEEKIVKLRKELAALRAKGRAPGITRRTKTRATRPSPKKRRK